jgi:transposase
VGRWRKRYIEDRVAGLLDEPRPGAPRTITDEQVEHVIVRTLESTPKGATHWSTREMARANTFSRQRAREFRRFLEQIDASVPAGFEVHLILDNASAHKSAAIQRWRKRHPRFHFHFTPMYGSWMNLVERWFSALTTKQLRRGVHRSVRELVKSIQEFIDAHNENCYRTRATFRAILRGRRVRPHDSTSVDSNERSQFEDVLVIRRSINDWWRCQYPITCRDVEQFLGHQVRGTSRRCRRKCPASLPESENQNR